MKKLIFLLSLFAILTYAIEGYSQQIDEKVKFRHLKENPLLSNKNINVTCQDSRGYLWIGTDHGLNRYDGYDIKTYLKIDNDSTSLISNNVRSIFEDSRGTLWVLTLVSSNYSLQYYNKSTDAFSSISEFSKKDYNIQNIMEDQDDNVWISGSLNSQGFLSKLDRQSGRWQIFTFPSVREISSMVQYSGNEFWLGSWGSGIFKWNKETNVLTQYKHEEGSSNSLPGNYIQEIVMDPYGVLWIDLYNDGLCKFDSKTNLFKTFTNQGSATTATSLPAKVIRDIYLDGDYLWIATENGGLSKMDVRTEALKNYLYSTADPYSIINNSIRSLYKDRQGRLWVGSFARGLCVLDPLEDKISAPDLPVHDDLVNAIFKDSKGRMWIGTEDGLVLQDKSDRHRFRNDHDDTNSLGSNAVMCIYEDHKHSIWIGLYNGGLNRYNEDFKNFTRYVPDPSNNRSISGAHVFSIIESSVTGELLVTTNSGLNILKDEKKGVFENPFEYPPSIDKWLLNVFEDSKQNLWTTSWSELSLHSLEDKTVKSIDVLNDTTKVSGRVNCIFEDHNGIIWIGSMNGLHQMVSPTQFITYTVKDGLPINDVFDIIEDDNGGLWLGTTNGLTVFNPRTKSFKTYDESDGLGSKEFQRRSFFKDENGEIYVGGVGIRAFYPDSVISNPHEPPVYITGLKVFNQSIKPKPKGGILKGDIADTEEIFLNHTQSFFSLSYVGINLTNSYKNQYAYQLEGFDNDWINVGTQRFASFTNLDAGTYTFRLKASNNDGLWNEKGASLIIHILPPWWLTWWAKTIWLLFITGSLKLAYALRVRSLNRQRELLKEQVALNTIELEHQKERLEELNKEKNKLLGVVAHDLRSPLNSVKGLINIYEIEKDETEKNRLMDLITVSTDRMRDMINRILDVSAIESQQINLRLEEVKITELLHELILNFQIIAKTKNQQISLHTNGETALVLDKNYLIQVIENLVSNAFKYSEINTETKIVLEEFETKFRLSVIDQGPGITEEEQKSLFKEFTTLSSITTAGEKATGLGLSIVKKYVEGMGGEIWCDSEIGIGSKFIIEFPITIV
ncbi:MAG: ATP-binding protein [Reichenbachiella sp.]